VSPAQNTFYWRLWSGVRKKRPGADRKAMHAELGLPESHTVWTNAHFDAWKGACLAVTQPANLDAQLAQQRMAATRHRVFIGHVLAALGEGEAWVEGIVHRMNRERKLGGNFASYDTLGAPQLAKVIVAVKKEAKRRWRTKEDLLQEVCSVLTGLDPRAAKVAVCEALNCPVVPSPKDLVYEDLLVVLGTVRRLAEIGAEEHDAAEPAPTPRWTVDADVPAENIPF
jgi:hypothetical protein